ncbi:MAG: hypothetical protein ABMA25_12245 [Ilumatobacteraceae bacterium]
MRHHGVIVDEDSTPQCGEATPEPARQACIADTQEWLDDFVAEHS